MPGRNLFAFRSGPSAEALAGEGPTATYPPPPSSAATPQAIASIAGGTATPNNPSTAQVAGFEVKPGYVSTASTTPPASKPSSVNSAAAQANGFYGGSSSYQAPPAPTATASSAASSGPAGYTFGSKALTPKTDSVASTPSPSSSWTKTAPTTPPSTSYTTNSTGFTPPASSFGTPATTTPDKPNGFSLPTDSPAVAAISLPSSKSSEWKPEPVAPATPTVANNNSFAPPAASTPDFSTASTAPLSAPSTEISISDRDLDASPSGSYSPGSTSSAYGYPTQGDSPTTQGSIFR